MSRVLIVDGNNRFYAAYFAHEALSYEGLSTSAIYGMPAMLKYTISELTPDEVYVVWDGRYGADIRKSIWPSYKEHRKDNTLIDRDDLLRQKKVVWSMLKTLGVKQVIGKTLEADDAIYMLVKQMKKKYDKVIINTGDKDFNQLVTDQVNIYRQSYGDAMMIDPHNMKGKFGYTPEQCVDYLVLLGDSSDDIPGVKGVGKKTAADLLEKYGTVSEFLKTDDKFPRVNKDNLLEVYQRNRELIHLPLFYKKHIKGKHRMKLMAREWDPKKFHRICGRHGVVKLTDGNFLKTFKKYAK